MSADKTDVTGLLKEPVRWPQHAKTARGKMDCCCRLDSSCRLCSSHMTRGYGLDVSKGLKWTINEE